MNDFALVSEGITDQVAIENILFGFYQNDDLDITSIQPARDATDESRQGEYGGWERVLEYVSLEDFRKAFLYNNYVIVQIDTDCCEHENFGVQLTAGGSDRSVEEVINDVISILRSKMGVDIYEEFKRRIIFAIAVHSVECWLLPLYSNQAAHKRKIKNCEATLNRSLNRVGIDYIKNYEVYLNITKKLQSFSAVEICKNHNKSFEIFINSLPDLGTE